MSTAASWQALRLSFAIAEDGKALPQFPPETLASWLDGGRLYRMKLIGTDAPSLYTVVSAADWIESLLAQEQLDWEFEASVRCGGDEIIAYLYTE